MENRICTNCGVELDMGLKVCPLCRGEDENLSHTEQETEIKYPTEMLKMDLKQRRRYTWELSGIICASAIIVSLIADLVIDRGISWSLYPAISVAALWNSVTLVYLASKRIAVLSVGLLINTLGMLALIDAVKPPVNWFVELGLPIASSLVLLMTVLLILIHKANFRGFNILALVLVATSLQCIVIELFTDLFIKGGVDIGWSAITASVIIPFSGILMFLHYRLKRGKSLGSYFHV